MSGKDKRFTRSTGRSLKTLQREASDGENLVGRPSKSLKHQLKLETSIEIEVKRKNLSSKSKSTQANTEKNVTDNDLTNPEGASENYWQTLAEKRQIALQAALDENQKLHKIIEDLKEENALYKQMLDEANSFVEVIKEELANGSNNDTGIDVNDVSAADTTQADTSTQEAAEESETSSKE